MKIQMIFSFLSLVASEATVHTLGHGIGYSEYKGDSVVYSPFFAKSVVVVNSLCKEATASRRLGTAPWVNINNSFPGFMAPDNTVISFNQSQYCVSSLSYMAYWGQACRDGIYYSTNQKDTFEFDRNHFNLGPAFDFCYFYAPASKSIRYNVKSLKGNTASDVLLIYRTQINDFWYDRYESLEEQTNWSVTSDSPWVFRFVSQGGLTDEDCSFKGTIDVESKEKLPESAVQIGITKALNIGSAPRGVFQHNIAVPIVGFFAPTVLLISWVFAFWRIYRKPLDE